MKHTIYILISLLLINLSSTVLSTPQIPDILIFNGDTLSIHVNPLLCLEEYDSLRSHFFPYDIVPSSTACWKGYLAEWIIENDTLYLSGIMSCDFYLDSIRANLNELFGDRCINNKVKTDWFTGKLSAPQGSLILQTDMGFDSFYEKELEFDISNGILIGTKTYDNSKSRQSEFSQNREKLKDFIYSHIKWDSLPKFDDKDIKVFVQFSANENGKVDSAKIIRGYDIMFDNEAIRVAKSIPDWDVYYRHGVLQRINWTFAIIFSEENRKKYMKENINQ